MHRRHRTIHRKHRTIAFAFAAALVTTAASAEEITLRFATTSVPTAFVTREFYHPWADKISAEGKGVVQLDVRDGPSIASIFNSYPRVMNDVVHISFVLHNYVSGKFPYSEVAALPFVAESSEQAAAALWRLYKSGTLDKEYDEALPLMLIGLPQSLLHAAKPVKTLDDWSGLKVVGPTQLTALTTKYLGGTPLTLGSPEIYEAIQRGTADGGIVSFNGYQSFKLHEVTTFHIDTLLGTASGMVFMSRKFYGGLPEAVRKIIDANSGEAVSRAWGRWWDQDNERGRRTTKADPKHTVVTLSPEMRESFKKKLDGAVAEWAKSRPGVEAALAQYRQLLAQIAAEK
jgi:TRAP-type C4-dicarboxylate transport system substrate-binding protein